MRWHRGSRAIETRSVNWRASPKNGRADSDNASKPVRGGFPARSIHGVTRDPGSPAGRGRSIGGRHFQMRGASFRPFIHLSRADGASFERSSDRGDIWSSDEIRSVQIRVIGLEFIPPRGWNFNKYFFEFNGGEIRGIEVAESIVKNLDFKWNMDIKINAEFSPDQETLF